MLRSTPTLLLVLLAAVSAARADEIRFNRDIRPILSDNCYLCHGPDANHREADLRLDRRDEALDYGAIVPGSLEDSLLVERILSDDDDLRMPPASSTKSLTETQKQLLQRWIEEGAVYEGHWSLSAPVRSPPPAVEASAWPRGAIDRFILARLEREGLAPSPEADRRTLLRRVSLDLTGLPPTPVDIDAFLQDNSPDAYEAAVDRLLASPAYGERMAWDWLEASRYADTNGYQGDDERTMWPWRDWVVRAYNDNMPYDEFTLWQLAGDLLPDATQDQQLATAFCRNHPINGEGGRIPEENRVDYVFDMAETTGTVWLGLTFNCTRCHDHKFDALTRRDYYGLFAYFNQTPVTGAGRNPQTPPVLDLSSPQLRAELDDLQKQLQAHIKDVEKFEATFFERDEGQPASKSPRAEGLLAAERAALDKSPGRRPASDNASLRGKFKESSPEYAALLTDLLAAEAARDKVSGQVPRVMVMADQDEYRATYILEKGLYTAPGEEVTAATPAALPPLAEGAPQNRLGLARWIVAPENPLTARVTVNRLWQMLMGTGLVKTASDFGVQGENPSHPELLDWLAVEFVESGWDQKHLLRLIVTSAAYRQSSRVTPALLECDPENRLLARGPRYRLPSWMLRDQALAAAGLLVHETGGPPVFPYQPDGVWEEATFGRKSYHADHGEGLYRRSLYTFWRRIIGPTLFFDTPSRSVCSVEPTRTNTPLHALATLNDTTYVEAARALAGRVMTERTTPADRIDRAFLLVLGRRPDPREQEILLAGYARALEQFRLDPGQDAELVAVGASPIRDGLDRVEQAAWTGTCLTILNLDEALTKE